jgi:DNA-binding NarL/FixJ family response regulator
MKDYETLMIIEDWMEDQEQFEKRLSNITTTQIIPEFKYIFAWNGFEEKIPDITIDIIPLIERYQVSFVLLDLAWTKLDEKIIIMAMDNKKSNEEVEREISKISGIRFLDEVLPRYPDLHVIVVTQYKTDPLAKICLNRGAKQVFKKWESEKELEARIVNALWLTKQRRQEKDFFDTL